MRRAGRPAGFVLVLVLAMLVVLSLLAGTVAAITQRLRAQALVRQQDVQDQIDMASTRATLFYLLSTQPMTIGGLTVDAGATSGRDRFANPDTGFSSMPIGNEITLDGRAYRGIGATRFAFQDDAGLFGVKMQPALALERLLAQVGGGGGVPAPVLIDRLMDYQDKDDLYRLNSMERDGYAKLGLPPPSNLPLMTPMELLRIPGWGDALSRMSGADINGLVTTEYVGTINVNTAPPRVLRIIPGVTAELAERAVARRKVQPFLTEGGFYQALGLSAGAESSITMYPSMSGTLKLWPARGGQVQLVHWSLTPGDDGGKPWREDYELTHSHDRTDGGVALPVASRLFAKPVAAER